jgi:DNA-binding transcriptional regulator YiaG
LKAEEGMMLEFKASGLPDIYLEDGYEYRETSEGKALVIHKVEALFETIGQAVAQKLNLSAAEVRFLRKHMDLSQKQLADILGVTEQTVSLWERAGSIPSTASLLLRVLYMERVANKPSAWQLAAAGQGRAADRLVFKQTERGWVGLAA